MTIRPPVVFDRRPPLQRDSTRVTVERRKSAVNSGDGKHTIFEVRHLDGQCSAIADRTANPARAAREATRLVGAHRPHAIWLVGTKPNGAGSFYSTAWRLLARAAARVQAAFVAWTG